MCNCKSHKKNNLPKTKAKREVEKEIRKRSVFRTIIISYDTDRLTEKYHLN